MDGNYKPYSWTSSAERIDEILNPATSDFEEADSLPDRDRLTYTNGFYAYCSAIFVDIRGSSELTTKYQRPALARLYRAFISEMVAVLNGDPRVREVNIVGDCVWAVYNTPFKPDIDAVFQVGCYANTLLKLLNAKLAGAGYERIKIGIGMDYGRALMIKAGYKGSGINEVVYMGDIVNRAAHLAHKAGRGWESPMWIGGVFQQNLNPSNAQWLSRKSDTEISNVYTGNVVMTAMNDWVASL